MVSLTDTQRSQAKFHLAYHDGVPAGDRARLEKAATTLPDEWMRDRVGEVLSRCETAFSLTKLTAGDLGVDQEVSITGDVTSTTETKNRPSYEKRLRYYLLETNTLATTLGVRNYRDPQQAINGYLQDGGVFINSIPGPQGLGGAEWFADTGVPTNGQFGERTGDFYLDNGTGDVYKKVDETTWTKQLSLLGPAGTEWYVGTGVPTDGSESESFGDFYIDEATGDVYEKTDSTTWTLQLNIRGPQGIPGQGIDHVSLIGTSGDVKTYTLWGDVAETINLGTYDVQDGATGSVQAAGVLELVHQPSVGTVDSGETWLYAKSDGKLYFKPDGGVETEVGAGAGEQGGGASLSDIWIFGGW